MGEFPPVRALRVHEFGEGPRVDDVDPPIPGEAEVLVAMRYVGVNPLDVWVTQGTVAGGRQQLPLILGHEGVGIVDGRTVVVHGDGLGTVRDGLAAGSAAVPAAWCVDLPEGVDLVQAAGIAVVGVTAWRLVHELAEVESGESALVLGAAGGVGSMLVQLLCTAGCDVTAQTASEGKVAMLRQLGAGHVLVSDAGRLPELDPPPSVIFDPLGGAASARAVEMLDQRGRVILFGTSAASRAELDLRALYRKAGRIIGYSGTIEPMDRLLPVLRRVVDELARGRLRVSVDAVLPLAEGAEAHRRLLDREVVGKLILEV